MFIITRSENAYDQYGEYFEGAFESTPSLSELSKFFYNKTLEELDDDQILFLAHIRKGGGRQSSEGTWYCSYKVKSGIRFDPEQ